MKRFVHRASVRRAATSGEIRLGIKRPARQPEDQARRFLVRTSELLHAYGTPAHRLELALDKLARCLKVPAAFLVTPTAVMASLGVGREQTMHLVRADSGEINLGKLVEFDEILEDVEDGRSGVEDALERLDTVAAAGPRFRGATVALSWGLASASAAVFFKGTGGDVIASFLIGIGVSILARLLPRRPTNVGVFEPVASFAAAAAAVTATRLFGLSNHELVTVASLIVLIPGLSLTIGFTELAARHLVSGVARIAGAGIVFLTMLLGVGLAWRLGDLVWGLDVVETDPDKPMWSWWPTALVLAPLAFAVLFDMRLKEIPISFVTGVLGFLAARYGAPFLGGLVVGLLSNFYARGWDRPALVPMTPGVLLLVPGSIGFESLTAFFHEDAMIGVRGAFDTSWVAVSLVGGLLVAGLLLRPGRVL